MTFPVALCVSACNGSGDEPASDERGSAAGEVLGGTISDDMIPLEELRSTNPLAVETPKIGESAAVDPASGPTSPEAPTPSTEPSEETVSPAGE
ncbi:hypothetical protein [Qipengyuania sp.]|uniref:hypothetical protein n=1 Tax=Qipengyuania sp. TaxID=2004515 RepID=UPI0035C7B70A